MIARVECSVVVVTYESADVIGAAVRSIEEQLPGAQLIVVDNSPTPRTREALHAHPSVEIIHGQGNVGFGAGVNLGVRAARAPHVLVLNPDIEILTVDRPALDALLTGPALGIVAASERTDRGVAGLLAPERPWPAELRLSLVRWFLVPRELSLPSLPLRRARPQRLSGAAFLIRRSEFEALGGFNERLFLYFEDDELSRRYRAAGFPIVATSAILVAHEGQHASSQLLDRVIAWCLLSFVQMVFEVDGPAAAAQCAAQALRGLRRIRRAAQLVAPLPLVGHRAAVKGQSVDAVLAALRAASEDPPSPAAYRDAAPLLRAALAATPLAAAAHG